MAENNLPPEHENWAHEVLKAIKTGYSAEVEEAQTNQVSNGENGQTEEPVQVKAEEQQAVMDLAERKRVHQQELSKISRNLRSLTKAVHIAGKRTDVFIEDVTLRVFEDAKQLAYANLEQANDIMNKPDKKGFVDLAKVQAFMDRGEEYLRVMQSNFSEGQEITLDNMRRISAGSLNKVEDVYKQRAEVENWGIDLSRFDGAYEQSAENIRELNTALDNDSIAIAKQHLQAATINLAVLKDLLKKMKKRAAAAKKGVENRVQATETAATDLHARRSEIESDPKSSEEFEKLYDTISADCRQAAALIAAGKGIEAEKTVESAEDRFIKLQQIMLQSIAVHGSTAEEGDRNESDVQLLASDALELTGKADELAAQEGLVSGYNGLLPIFRKADKSARNGISKAQTDLLNGEVLAAEDKLEKVKLDLTEMHEIAIEAQSALEVASDQIALLKKQAAPLLARRTDVVKQAEANENKASFLEKFDKVTNEVNFNIDSAEAAVKNESLSEVNQDIANTQASIVELQYEVDRFKIFQATSTATTKEENAELFMQMLDRLRENIGEYNDHSDVFKDKEEKAIFDNLSDRAAAYAEQAEVLFKRQKYEDADDAINNAHIALNGLEISLERGVKTAAKLESLKLEIQDAYNRIQAFENIAKAIVNDELRGEFLSYKVIAESYVREALDYITQGRITDARGALADLKQAMVNLNEFVANPPKPKQSESYQGGTETLKPEVEEETLSDEEKARREELEDIALFINEWKQLRIEVDQVKAAVKEGNKVWERFCQGDYLQRFQQSFENANKAIDEATDWLTSGDELMTPGPRMKVNQDLYIASAREPISEAKKALRDMENAFDVSKQIMMSQLNGISEGAQYYIVSFDTIYKLREELAGWEIDLSAFDNAYLTAMDNIADLKVAIENQDIASSSNALELAEKHRQNLLQISNAAESAALDAEHKVAIRYADMVSDYIKLSKLEDTLANFPEILKTFESADSTAKAGLDKALELINAGEGKAAAQQFPAIEKAMDVMVEAIGDGGTATVRAELDAQAQHDADITAFRIKKSEVFADVKKLQDLVMASYDEWWPSCRDTYFESIFIDAFDNARQNLAAATDLNNSGEDEDRKAIIAGMESGLQEALNAYNAMDNFRKLNEDFTTSEIKGLNQRADSFEKIIDNVSISLDQYADWGLDFSEFETNYNAAKGLIEQLREVLLKKDYLNGLALNQKLADAVKVVESEKQRYANLFEEAKASFIEGFENYRESIADIVKRRPELEKVKHLAASFDDAERSALQAIDRGIALIKKGDRFGPDKESEFIINQQEIMLRLLEEAVPLAKNPEKLGLTIDESQQKLAEFDSLKKDIRDGMDREVFEAMQVRGAEYAAEAQRLMEAEDYEKAEFQLFALQVINEALQSRHDSGVAIAAKVPELEKEIDDVTEDLTDLEKLSSHVQNDEDAVQYRKFHSISIETAFEAKDFLLKGEIRRAQAALNTLQYYLDKMEEILDKQGTKSPKRRSGSKKAAALEEQAAATGEEMLKPSEELEREDSFEPADDVEQRANLENDIVVTDQLLETAIANAEDLIDVTERELYDTMCDRATEYSAAAKDNLAKNELDDGDGNIDYLKVTLDSLHDAHLEGLITSKLKPAYQKELDEASDQVISLNLKRESIKDDNDKTEFDTARNAVTASVYQIARLLQENRVRKVKYELEALRQNLGKMAGILSRHTNRRQKLKEMLKRRRK